MNHFSPTERLRSGTMRRPSVVTLIPPVVLFHGTDDATGLFDRSRLHLAWFTQCHFLYTYSNSSSTFSILEGICRFTQESWRGHASKSTSLHFDFPLPSMNRYWAPHHFFFANNSSGLHRQESYRSDHRGHVARCGREEEQPNVRHPPHRKAE